MLRGRVNSGVVDFFMEGTTAAAPPPNERHHRRRPF